MDNKKDANWKVTQLIVKWKDQPVQIAFVDNLAVEKETAAHTGQQETSPGRSFKKKKVSVLS